MKVFRPLFLTRSYFMRRAVMVTASALGLFLVLYYGMGPGWDAAMKKAMSPFGAHSATVSLKGAPAEPLIRIGRLSYELSPMPQELEAVIAASVEVVQPRVIEGRDFVMPAMPTPAALPITEASAGNLAPEQRNTSEGSRTLPGPAVLAASPIRPVSPSVQRVDTTAAPDPAKLGEGEIQTRLAATREWLAASPDTMHTLQLFGATSEEQLKADLATLSGVLNPGELRVYRTLIAGKPAYTVVYGSYADRRTALQALDKLPASATVSRPLVRTVSGIRGEQRRHGV
jgi:SPOR domain